MTPARASDALQRAPTASVALQRRETAGARALGVEKAIAAIEVALAGCGAPALSGLSHVERALCTAEALRSLRGAMSDDFVKAVLLPLAGTGIGFVTDKDRDGGYGLSVVRDVCLEALLRGLNLCGGEFAIISSRLYVTRAGLFRLVSEFPGLTDLVLQPGAVTLSQDKTAALVSFSARWRFRGEPMRIDCTLEKDGAGTITDLRIPVRANAGMGRDALIGKAERKMLHRIYQRLHGAFGLDDTDVGEAGAFVTTGELARAAPALARATEDRRSRPRGDAGQVPPEPPEPSVDVTALHEALARVDPEEWGVPGVIGIIELWSEPERRAAWEWAAAVLTDQPMQLQAARPEHTRRPSTLLAPRDIE